jgi:hypothetical protein
MRQLRFVGPGDEGTVILESHDGAEQFSLAVDDRLRTVVCPDARDGEAKQAGPDAEHAGQSGEGGPASKEPIVNLPPREIQVRVRSGENPQAIADETGAALDKIMRFAYPVLQERIRVTDEARRARARRGSDSQLVVFGELANIRFAAHNIDPDEVTWDSYRRSDGGWTVTAKLPESSNPAGVPVLAKFAFALMNRTVSALDQVAADLLAERPIQALAAPVTPPVPTVQPDDDEETTEATQPGAPVRLTAVPDADHATDDEAKPAVRPPARRQRARTRPLPVAPDDELFDQEALDTRPVGATPNWQEPELPLDLAASRQQPGSSDTGDPAVANESRAAGEAAAEQAPEPNEAVQQNAAQKKAHRSSDKPRMPSWDDILLGVRRKTE